MRSDVRGSDKGCARQEAAVIAQVAKDRFRIRTKDAVRFVSVMVTFAVATTWLVRPPAGAAETPKAQSSPKAEEKAAPAKPAPISVEDYFAAVLKPGISAADQASFAKKHAGADVTWTGYVRTLNKNLSPDGVTYQIILKTKPTEEGGAPIGLFIAQLPGADEKQLLALQKDQKVTVSGTLEVGNPALPSVAKAKLSGS
jgi:hypothetical protein